MAGTIAINRNLLLSTVVRFLPDRMRRAALLASFAGATHGVKPEDQQTIHKLNQVLHLATYEGSLRLPIHVSSIIWKDADAVKTDVTALRADCDECDQQACAKHLVSCIPAWFSYGTPDEMVSDFINLVRGGLSTPPTLAAA